MPFPDDFVGPILPFPFIRSTFWRKRKPVIYRVMTGSWDAEMFYFLFNKTPEERSKGSIPLEEVLYELKETD